MAFGRAIATVGAATLVSRVLGFLRDVLVAGSLGAGPVADAFVVAFRLPSLMRRLLADGAVNIAFVPVYGEAAAKGEADAFSADVLCWVAALFLLLTALGLAAMPLLVIVVAPGLSGEGALLDLTVELSRITFPYCLATAVSAVAAAILNTHGRVTAAAYAPTLVNLATIAVIFAAPRVGWRGEEACARAIAWAILAGGAAQCALVVVSLARAGLLPRPRRLHLTAATRRFMRLAVPGVVASGITQVNAVVGLFVGSALPGAMAWLYYADRVYQLPLGLVSAALAATLLPEIGRRIAARDHAGEIAAFSRATEFAVALAVPAAIALVIGAHPIVAALFQRGAFGAGDSLACAAALRGYALGLPAFAGARLLQPLFFARSQIGLPFRIAIFGAAVDLLLALLLFPVLQQVAIALAAAAAGWLNLTLLAVAAWRRDLIHLDEGARRRLPRMVLASVLMAAALQLALAWLDARWLEAGPAMTGAGRMADTLLFCAFGLAAFVIAALALGALRPRSSSGR
jgi:putative peptidoglycan lipid II flippase